MVNTTVINNISVTSSINLGESQQIITNLFPFYLLLFLSFLFILFFGILVSSIYDIFYKFGVEKIKDKEIKKRLIYLFLFSLIMSLLLFFIIYFYAIPYGRDALMQYIK